MKNKGEGTEWTEPSGYDAGLKAVKRKGEGGMHGEEESESTTHF